MVGRTLNPLNFHEMAKLQKQINVPLAFGVIYKF